MIGNKRINEMVEMSLKQVKLLDVMSHCHLINDNWHV